MGRRVSVPLSAELGVDTDYEVVDLFEGGNFDPKFLKLVSSDLVATFSLSYKPHSSQNPGATLPTLAHNGKSYTSTADVIDYLVSISPKKVAPATSITTVVHEQNIDPNFAFVASVRDLFFHLPIPVGGGVDDNRLSSAKRRGTCKGDRRRRCRFHSSTYVLLYHSVQRGRRLLTASRCAQVLRA